MSKFRTKLGKWTAVSLDDKNDDRGGGGGGFISSAIELLTLVSEFTLAQLHSFSSAWKPVWYTSWHTGVLSWAAAVAVVLLINVGLTIYVATKVEYKIERGTGPLYSGSCAKIKIIELWLQLGINVLSTLLLSGSNYTQQCLAAPTLSEIDAAHSRRRVRNLFRIKAERTFLWIAIGITSVPLHLLYNSAVYTPLATNYFFATAAYSNTTEYLLYIRNMTTEDEYTSSRYPPDSQDFQLLTSMLEEYNTSNPSYEDLTPSQCLNLYNTDFPSSYRNLFLITNHTSNSTSNDTLLRITKETWFQNMQTLWIGPPFTMGPLASEVERGEQVEVTRYKSEITKEKCKVQFSPGIMMAVISCSLIKACSMIMTVVRSREPPLVTLGNAIDSFLRIPDSTPIGICFADRRFIERDWKCGSGAGPKQWTQIGKSRWITCNLFCSVSIITTSVLLGIGIKQEGRYVSTEIKSLGFGKVNTISTANFSINNITKAGWFLFGHHHHILRVTSPCPGRRSKYQPQIPYTYVIPLMIVSALLHWLISQSIFLVRLDALDAFGELIPAITTVGGYSAAISSACHLGSADPQEIIGKKVAPSLGVRHLTFSSDQGVRKPVFGEVYTRTGREKK
ncbi:hypothetical protein B9Z19DRAFT_1168396 [Tuber borchii]|uniref:DUF6536 domain-containing protein n=1 Tax=Tuber borchii TaxID=42251 RepID=A0A2T7A045_TUBBO|nr:hypothetical protein B9Z19DRAFT_1168396 [Tuber borchii]